jgi:hypothetical protein
MTPSGIETATFRLVAHCLNKRRYRVPPQQSNTVELHFSGLIGTATRPVVQKIGTATRPVVQKIGIIGFFFENVLHWQFAVRLLLFAVCAGV